MYFPDWIVQQHAGKCECYIGEICCCRWHRNVRKCLSANLFVSALMHSRNIYLTACDWQRTVLPRLVFLIFIVNTTKREKWTDKEAVERYVTFCFASIKISDVFNVVKLMKPIGQFTFIRLNSSRINACGTVRPLFNLASGYGTSSYSVWSFIRIQTSKGLSLSWKPPRVPLKNIGLTCIIKFSLSRCVIAGSIDLRAWNDYIMIKALSFKKRVNISQWRDAKYMLHVYGILRCFVL